MGLEFLNSARGRAIALLVGGLVVASCGAALPGEFWEQFQADSLVARDSNQGPYGGYLTLHWQARAGSTLDRESVLNHASSNDWRLVREIELNARDLAKWDWLGTRYFPISRAGYEEFAHLPDTTDLLARDPRFPVRVTTDASLFMFDTNTVLFERDENGEPIRNAGTSENGFLLLGKDGQAMSIYHMWGQ